MGIKSFFVSKIRSLALGYRSSSQAYRNYFHSKGDVNRETLGKTFENYQRFCEYMNKG